MERRIIWYNKRDVRNILLVWLVLFAGIVCWNLSVARQDHDSSVPVLSGINVFMLMPYWGACLVYSLVLYAFLAGGQRFWRFPVFIMLQVIWLVCDQGSDAFDFILRTWHKERYVLAPFAYSLVVYIWAQVFRNRIRLYDEAAERDEIRPADKHEP